MPYSIVRKYLPKYINRGNRTDKWLGRGGMGQVVKISDGMHNICNELKHILRKWKSYSIYIQIWNIPFGCQLAYIHLLLPDLDGGQRRILHEQ